MLAALGRRKLTTPSMRENAAFQQDKSHKPLAYLVEDRICHTKFRLKYSRAFGNLHTNRSLACRTLRKLEEKADQAHSKTNDKLNISNSQNYPLSTLIYPTVLLSTQKWPKRTCNLECSRCHQDNHNGRECQQSHRNDHFNRSLMRQLLSKLTSFDAHLIRLNS